MATAERRWLMVAAERREFDGVLRRAGASSTLDWPAEFAAEARLNGDCWVMIANGPGKRLVEQALEKKIEVDGMISTGFCGALDPALRVGDIVVGRSGSRPAGAEILCLDRVASTAAEKRELREKTGAAAVEMESAAVAGKATEWGVPFYAIRAVSDTADDDMPIDFNLYRDAEGRFSRRKIALAALSRPFTRVPALLRLDRNLKIAAQSLGDYFAHCRL
jgi:adenosylhomocysteine nucleosidase